MGRSVTLGLRGRILPSPPGTQVDVVRGCGRYIPRAPYSEAVYSRILQRDRVWVPEAVDRAPYSGPVIVLPVQ